MSQIIKLKRNSTLGATPNTTDLVPGELAINTADGKLYTINETGDAIAQLGGIVDAATNGTTGDLELYTTDGSTITYSPTPASTIENDLTVTGNLELTNETDNDNHLPELRLTRNHGPASNNDELGAIVIEGDNYLGDQKPYARISSFVDDAGASSSGNVSGRIEFSIANGIPTALGGDPNNALLETPSLVIDSDGITLPQATGNFVAFGRAQDNGLRYWQSGSSGFKTDIKAVQPSQNNEIQFPNTSGTLLTDGLAGGSINGGNGLAGAARTTWDLDQVKASQNTSYYHYRDAAYGSSVDLVVSVPYPIYDGYDSGTSWTYYNLSTDTGSDIIIDVDSYLAGSSTYLGPVYYARTDLLGSAPIVSTSISVGISYDNFKIPPGGYIKLTVIDGGVYHVEGVAIATVAP